MASDREYLNWGTRAVETCLQVENYFSALDPEQMVPGAFRVAFDRPDSEDIDMPRRDLERVAVVVEHLGVAAIEDDAIRRAGVISLIGRSFGLLEQRLAHSWATSLA